MSAPKQADPRATARELIEQREKLRSWIAKLDEVRITAPDRVAQKIRGDYEARLAGVTEELGSHRDDLQRELDAKQAEMRGWEEQHAAAVDALEETRLRHLIGELEDANWEKSRLGLERDVADADAELARVGTEVSELSDLLSDLSDPSARAADMAPTRASVAAPAAVENTATKGKRAKATQEPVEPKPSPEPVDLGAALGDEVAADADGEEDELPWLDDLEKAMDAWDTDAEDGSGLEFLDGVADVEQPRAAEEDTEAVDLAFLAEIDKAIADASAPATAAGDTSAGGTPTASLTCKDCGATNEAHAWYCEVCGTEL